MPWVLFDPDDQTYYCHEAWEDEGEELWQQAPCKWTLFETPKDAMDELADVDVEKWLPQIKATYVEPVPTPPPTPPPPRKPWEEMTFDEKMAQIEEDFQATLAERVQRKMLATKPSWDDTRSFVEKVKELAKDFQPLMITQQKGEFTKDDMLLDKKFIQMVDYSSLELRVLKGLQDERREESGAVPSVHGGDSSDGSRSGGLGGSGDRGTASPTGRRSRRF